MSANGLDLKTTYLGLKLKNPLVPSAGPLTGDLSRARELEDMGAAAIVLPSLFEEELDHETRRLQHFLEHGTESYAEATSYFPEAVEYLTGPDEYLERIRRMKAALEIPVIASLNGVTATGWTESARRIEQAGADALELNVYYVPTSPEESGRSVEERYLEALRAVRLQVKIPVAVKIGPYFSSLATMAQRFEEEGANGLVLFNRFYQPDIDLENLDVFPNIHLSGPMDLRLPLRWIAILSPQVSMSLAASGGVDRAPEAIKLLLVGATVVMMCSTLLRNGPARLKEVLLGLRNWMFEREYSSLEILRGSMSHRFTSDPSAFERANYIKALKSFV